VCGGIRTPGGGGENIEISIVCDIYRESNNMSPVYEQKVGRVIRSEDTEEWLLLCFQILCYV